MIVISSATVIDGELTVRSPMYADTFAEAIQKAQNMLMEDFGYADWMDYMSQMDPEITENEYPNPKRVYIIRDENCGHMECYRIEEVQDEV